MLSKLLDHLEIIFPSKGEADMIAQCSGVDFGFMFTYSTVNTGLEHNI